MTTDAAINGPSIGNHSMNGSDVRRHSEQVTDDLSEKERDLIDELRTAVTPHAVRDRLQTTSLQSGISGGKCMACPKAPTLLV